MYSIKTNIETTKSKIFTRFSFITKLCSQEWTCLCNKVETHKDFRFSYFWLYFVYQNFQNGYFLIILLTIYSLINNFSWHSVTSDVYEPVLSKKLVNMSEFY